MQPTNVNLRTMFGNKIQYLIPLFQRHYVWTLEEQWQPLWEDIEQKANKRFDIHQIGKVSHFTGAIVIQQRPTNVDEVPKYEIIDGQQRLTTFQVILSALRDVCEGGGLPDVMEEIEVYTLNKGMLSPAYKNERYKLVPTDFDRFSFFQLIDGSVAVADALTQSRILQCYRYYRAKVETFCQSKRERVLAIFHSILNDFDLVQILIDSDDEPEMIFESLNGRGKSLLQFDLLRNNLFLRTRITEHDRDALYGTYWADFETPYWEAEVKLGRRKEILSELFLQHFLMAKLASDNVFPLYKVYQRQYRRGLGEKATAPYELNELHRYSRSYRQIWANDFDSVIGQYSRFYQIFDITSLHPFLLYLACESQASEHDLFAALKILESYTIRRILCTTQGHKNFNKFFAEVIKKVRGQPFRVSTLYELLKDQRSDTSRWPSDTDVRKSLHGFWNQIDVNPVVLRYILYRAELLDRGKNRLCESTDLPFSQLTLEHIMPKSWAEHWQLPTPDGPMLHKSLFSEQVQQDNELWWEFASPEDLAKPTYEKAFELAQERDKALHSIGNLTVVTQRLNSSLSKRSFTLKKESLFGNSTLLMNRKIAGQDNWDVGQIAEREEEIANRFLQLWPTSQQAYH